ncbi:Uncharacterised protein [Mannheimia haemolytica]|nr:Uncharacterised protein [Mannheimia haemolytica]
MATLDKKATTTLSADSLSGISEGSLVLYRDFPGRRGVKNNPETTKT